MEYESVLTIAKEIENPVVKYNLQKTYDIIKMMNIPKEFKSTLEIAVIKATKKNSFKLKTED